MGMSTRIVYSPRYDIGFFGLEKLHPFDSRKYSRAWRRLSGRLPELKQRWIQPTRAASFEDLRTVHHEAYFDCLKDSRYLAQALEVAPLALLPAWAIQRIVLGPMRWAVQGTVAAAREAMIHGLAINLGGGYHHAKPHAGEGFCIFNDIALAIETMRGEARLKPSDRVAYIDLDAHMGNGVAHAFLEDSRVFLFDIYNGDIYPQDPRAEARLDCRLPVSCGTGSDDYMTLLREQLPSFLDSVSKTQELGLAIYNAGTDVYELDPLGQLSVSAEAILARDLFVLRQLWSRKIPSIMLLSGGYHADSYKLVADSIEAWLRLENSAID